MFKNVLGRRNRYEDLDRTSSTPSIPPSFPPSSSSSLAETDQVAEKELVTLHEVMTWLGFGPFQVIMVACTGFFWMTDGMEITILSIIGPALVCEWKLAAYEKALLNSVAFVGMSIGSAAYGVVADRHGRKTQLIMAAVSVAYFGLLSAFSPSFIWLLVIRTVVGTGLGGVSQSVTLYAELLPTQARGRCIALLELFWALGSSLIVTVAIFVMPTYGWRYMFFIASLPAFIFLPICIWLPESPRFNLARGRGDLALKTLQKVATFNRKPPLKGKLVWNDSKVRERGRIADLWQPPHRLTTALLWVIWILSIFCYYGVIFMTTELFLIKDGCHGGDQISVREDMGCCKGLELSDYTGILWTTVAEFPGFLLALVLIEVIGRKPTIFLFSIIFSIFIFLVNMCASRLVLTIFLFVGRACVSGNMTVLFIYTTEVYPTTIRGLGLGACNGVARMGGLVTPFVAQVLLRKNLYVAINLYAVLGLLGAVSSLLLPLETKGKDMNENAPSDDEEDDNNNRPSSTKTTDQAQQQQTKLNNNNNRPSSTTTTTTFTD